MKVDFTFLKRDGTVAFMRDDAEEATWTQEEMSVNAVFPYVSGKIITNGMTLLFRDPALSTWQAFEIRTATRDESSHFQRITAESIAIAELSDCHVEDTKEFSSVTAKSAVRSLLSGTGWEVGTDTSGGNKSSGDAERGSVWQALGVIKENWNVYITPRVTVGAGGITNRYLDIESTDGVWRGVRLSFDKNLTDPIVTYDDTETYTALYGYGGSKNVNNETVETTFADSVWSKTSAHPAKPKGQKYLEWPEKTKLYGRNGKPRFGYYQNVGITSAGTLLSKTWEALKNCCEPKISISGTVTELKRLGYADVPMRLHDLAMVEIRPIGVNVYKQIIQLTVDLLNATETRPVIGDYIPNIIYINRDTNTAATGGSTGVSSSGRGGGGGGSRKDKTESEFWTKFNKTDKQIELVAGQSDKNGKILKAAGIDIDANGVAIYARGKESYLGSKLKVTSDAISAEVKDRKAGDATLSSNIKQTADKIETEVKERKDQGKTLSSRIEQTKNKISLVVEEKNGKDVIKSASIVTAINDGTSEIKLSADRINLSGYVTASQLNAVKADISNLTTGVTQAGYLNTATLKAGVITFGSYNLRRGYLTVEGVRYQVVMWGS